MQNEKPVVPVLLGPTASGKTSVGIALAKLVDGEIISVDSRKVYKGLKVGTATPEGTWDDGVYKVDDVPHHLIGNLEPDQPYTAGDFARDAEALIKDIFARGKTPLLVGGTGFYFKALQKGLPQLPKRDDELRAQFTCRIEENGLEDLHKELRGVDPLAANAIGTQDRHKLIRALEIYYLTGKPFSFWKNTEMPAALYTYAVMALLYPKQQLDERIDERSKKMAEEGMIEETAALLKQGFSKTCPALSSFGYREAVQVVEGKMTAKQFLPSLIQGTKAYAKRQRTWLRTQVAPHWFEINQHSTKEQVALKMKHFLDSELVYSA
jgi:tRNA dimethylallyltransferase